MKILITEQLSKNKYKDNSGYLICKDAILARTGTQQYLSKELFKDGDDTIIDVDRPKEEVLNEKTIASFENKPVTDEHPDVDVVPLNCKDLQIGFARDIHAGVVDGQDVILGTLVITDANAIEMIETGEKIELSCGYDCDIMKDEEGNYYQANIRGNHIALCEAGRAGIARIVDSKVEDSKDVNVKVCLSKQRYAVVSTKEWRTWKDDAYADITTDTYNEAKQYQDGCKYDTIIIDCYNNYSILDSKTNDGYFSRYQAGEFRDGVYKVMKRSTYEIDKKRHDLQANPGPTFDDLAEAKAKAKQLGPDYVVVNLYTRMIMDAMLKDTAMTITVQCYILDEDKILIQDRVSDVWHGLAVPGGHVKNDETTEAACIREIKEETGLDVSNLVLFGTNEYTCEEDGKCIALLYKTTTFSGELQSSDEGEVKWMTIDEVLNSDNTAEGFKDLLTKCVGNSVKDSAIKDSGTQRRQFRQSDLDDKDSWLGTTEWSTPKGSMYVYVEGSTIVAECKGIAYGEPRGIFKFGSLQELNRWLLDGKMYDSAIKDDRLSPMSYKKLKELGYNSDDWSDMSQEEANKIIQENRDKDEKKSEKKEEKKTETKNKHSEENMKQLKNALSEYEKENSKLQTTVISKYEEASQSFVKVAFKTKSEATKFVNFAKEKGYNVDFDKLNNAVYFRSHFNPETPKAKAIEKFFKNKSIENISIDADDNRYYVNKNDKSFTQKECEKYAEELSKEIGKKCYVNKYKEIVVVDSIPSNIQYSKRIIDKRTIFDLKIDGKYVASFDSFNTMIFYISKYSK